MSIEYIIGKYVDTSVCGMSADDYDQLIRALKYYSEGRYNEGYKDGAQSITKDKY